MKTLITKLLTFSGLALLAFSSCKKDGEVVSIGATAKTAPTLAASSTTPALVRTNLTGTAVTFTTTAPNYGYSAVVTNTLQIDTKGDNFATPKKEVILSSLTQAYTVQEFNNILLGMSLPTGVSAQIEVRIKSYVGTNSGVTYSNVVSLTATPFALASYIYLPGAYQGWDPTKADSLQSATSNNVYVGIINYVGSDQHFKITPIKKWDVAYGDGGTGKISTSGGDILAPTKATVDPAVNIKSNLVTVDLVNNTITMVPTQWSLVGDATPGSWPNGSGYQSDTDLKYNNATQTWSATVALTVGAIKFRLNHDWGTNYGSLAHDGNLDTKNDNNIPITVAGTYVITLDINKLTYTAVKQ